MSLHPLKPLTASEVQLSTELLKRASLLNETTRVISIALKEPLKPLIYTFDGSTSMPREAEAVLFDNQTNSGQQVYLNLTDEVVTGTEPCAAGGQPTMSADEQVECEHAVLSNPEFQAAMERQYGVTDMSLGMVGIWSAGNYGSEEDLYTSSCKTVVLPAKGGGREWIRASN